MIVALVVSLLVFSAVAAAYAALAWTVACRTGRVVLLPLWLVAALALAAFGSSRASAQFAAMGSAAAARAPSFLAFGAAAALAVGAVTLVVWRGVHRRAGRGIGRTDLLRAVLAFWGGTLAGAVVGAVPR